MSTDEKHLKDNEASLPMTQTESSNLTTEIEATPVPSDAGNDGGQPTLQRELDSQEVQLAPSEFDISDDPGISLDEAVTEIELLDDDFEAFIEELEEKEFFRRHRIRPDQAATFPPDPRILDQLHDYMTSHGNRVGFVTNFQGPILQRNANRTETTLLTVPQAVEEVDESPWVEEVAEEDGAASYCPALP